MSAVLDYDPDVIQAIEDLGPVGQRLRMLEEDILRTDEAEQHRRYMGLCAGIGQCRDSIKLRAERIGLHPAALEHLLNQEFRVRDRINRKPSRADLRRALVDVVAIKQEELRAATVRARRASVRMSQVERELSAAIAAQRAFDGSPAND